MGIHENIKRLRNEQNLTLEEVGKRTGTTKQTIKRYEDGEISTIPYDRIIALAKCFGVSPGYIMGWENFTEQAAIADADLLCLTPKQKDYIIRISKLSEDKQECLWSVVDNFEKLNEDKEE